MEFEFLVNNAPHKISLERKGEIFIVSDGKNTYEADIRFISPNVVSILIGNRSFQVYLAKDKEKRYLSLGGQQLIVQEALGEAEKYEREEERTQKDELMVMAPMPGKVIKINVSENEEIRKNQTLAIVEAMKMENEIKSSIDGRVKKILVSVGELVDSENPLIELEPKE